MTKKDFKKSDYTCMDIIHAMVSNFQTAQIITKLVNNYVDLIRYNEQKSKDKSNGTSGTITISKEDLKVIGEYELTFTTGCKD